MKTIIGKSIRGIIAAALLGLMFNLGACSGDDQIIFKTGSAGPNTKNLLKTLPDGLIPDTENVNHTKDDLKPAEG